jgi:transketolase
MRDAFIRTLTEWAELDRRIFLITGDLGFGVLTEFARRFPDQYLNVGVAEQAMTGIAAGLAAEGRTVITYSIGNFPTLRCLEQIRNDVCYHGANVKIVAVGGGMSYGPLGVTHHATEDIAIMRSLPGMTVLVPGDVWEAEHATRRMLAEQGPCYLRLDKSAAHTTHLSDETFHIGKFRTVRQGKDVTLIASGGILGEALKAATRLEAGGMSVRVMSAHTVKPMDADTLAECVRGTGGIVTIEEHALDGGLGGAVAECCMDAGIMPRKFLRLGLKNEFSSLIGSQDYQRAAYGLDAESIANAVAKKFVLARRGRQEAVA